MHPAFATHANPPFLEEMKSKHGDILVLPESSTNDDGCYNAEKMVNQTENYRLFNNDREFPHVALWYFVDKAVHSRKESGIGLRRAGAV